MVTLGNTKDYDTVQTWWNDVRLLADTFFNAITYRPAETPAIPVTSLMVHLHTTMQKLSRLSPPAESRTAHQHLLDSVRYLQLSLAEVIAHNPAKSNIHYDAACRHYQQAQRALHQLGVKQVP
jgi:hypothetical protein